MEGPICTQSQMGGSISTARRSREEQSGRLEDARRFTNGIANGEDDGGGNVVLAKGSICNRRADPYDTTSPGVSRRVEWEMR